VRHGCYLSGVYYLMSPLYLLCYFVGEVHASLLYVPSQALEIDPIYLIPHFDTLCSAEVYF